jgi:Ca-activated chloride channel family protein
MHFLHPFYFFLLAFLPLFWWLDERLEQWRQESAAAFADRNFLGWLFPGEATGRRILKRCLWMLAFVALVSGLARPQGPAKITSRPNRSLTVYVVLDCSLSMRCQDVLPSRMAAARQTLLALAGLLPQDRIGLVGFAGTARVFCPATEDHEAFKLSVQQVSDENLEKPGSNPAVGLALATARLRLSSDKAKAILLISDGEGNRPGNVSEAAWQAKRSGIPVFCLGIGTQTGGPIPLGRDYQGKEQYRIHQGSIVQTRLQDADLRQAAQLAGGKYFLYEASGSNAQAVALELDQLCRMGIRKDLTRVYPEWFAGFAGFGLLLLLVDFLIPGKRGRP